MKATNPIVIFSALACVAALIILVAVSWGPRDRDASESSESIRTVSQADEFESTTPQFDIGSDRKKQLIRPDHDGHMEFDIISFPDGDTLKVQWRSMPFPSERPQPPYINHYARLASEAEAGDPASAFALWTVLRTCRFAYEKESDLDRALETLYQTHSIQTPDMKEPKRFSNPSSLETWEMILTKTHEDCRGITAQQKSATFTWLEISANANYPAAMLEYSAYIDDFSEGVALDSARWRMGDSQGLNDLAKRYEEKYNSGESPELKIQAYAHLLAFTQLVDKLYNRDGTFTDPRYEQVKNRRAKIKAALRPNEHDQAVVQAKEIIRSNPNCCFRF